MYSFQSTLLKENFFFVADVPLDVIDRLGPARHIPVRGTAMGIAFTSTCVPRKGNRYVVLLNGIIRRKTGIAEGDRVDLSIEYDPEDREIPLPEDVEMILAEDEGVLQEFLNGSPSNRREYLKYIMQAKHEETRLKRIKILVQRMQERIQKRK